MKQDKQKQNNETKKKQQHHIKQTLWQIMRIKKNKQKNNNHLNTKIKINKIRNGMNYFKSLN